MSKIKQIEEIKNAITIKHLDEKCIKVLENLNSSCRKKEKD